MASPLGSLPEPVAAGLAGFVVAAQQAFGEDLVSVTLFGSAVEGRLRPTSDVNVIVVLARGDATRLAAIGEAYRLARAAIRLSAMFILETEIAAATEAFAVKFNDIGARHQVLFGPDLFSALSESREALSRRSRQVLMNLLLRLRERYALSAPFPDQLALAAADAVGPLRAAAAVLLFLETGERPPPREALRRIAEASGKTAALEAIITARENGGVPAIGGAATLHAAVELAGELSQRAERLAR
jgi:predicted nucleotidyltransferase